MSSRNLPGIPSNNPSAAVTQKPELEEEEKQGTLPKPIILKKQISLHGGGGGAATRLSSLESLGERSIDNAFRSHNFS
jgi:hypothetical protein